MDWGVESKAKPPRHLRNSRTCDIPRVLIRDLRILLPCFNLLMVSRGVWVPLVQTNIWFRQSSAIALFVNNITHGFFMEEIGTR